jgi:hypothetical protein
VKTGSEVRTELFQSSHDQPSDWMSVYGGFKMPLQRNTGSLDDVVSFATIPVPVHLALYIWSLIPVLLKDCTKHSSQCCPPGKLEKVHETSRHSTSATKETATSAGRSGNVVRALLLTQKEISSCQHYCYNSCMASRPPVLSGEVAWGLVCRLGGGGYGAKHSGQRKLVARVHCG